MIRASKQARLTIWAGQYGYRVDDSGELFSPTGRHLKPGPDRNGYRRFSVRPRDTMVSTSVLVHQLAAIQKFGVAALGSGVQVRHLDGDPGNNRRENLAIGSARDNQMDKPRALRVRVAKQAAYRLRRLTPEQVASMRREYSNGSKLVALAAKYSVAKSTASYIVNRKTYREPDEGGD